MKTTIFILNGCNLNLLGAREPHIYGHETLADVEAECRRVAAKFNLDVQFRQTNAESQLIDWIHEARESAAGIVINPAGWTSTSIALLDALKTFDGPIMEVHISNIHQREVFRHYSYISLAATGVICGCGTQGYSLAIQRLGYLLAGANS
ncbi:MAG: type II 3-dehydroquinate dehydratase [Planctomycetota bacterium]|nr:type II 3-dehydroquinate dehydratase [Planctomycetota bacterium]MDA1179994.1 type II 3-dehydroquinate dehydratase [Planctomycetota bacterium]